MILPQLDSYIKEAIKGFDSIPEERKKTLDKISQFVQKNLSQGKTSELIYVCTHNSRRSHFGQIWGKTAAAYYGIKNVNTYSAGTETTAFNPNAIKAAQNAGFKISKDAEVKNPLYSVVFNEDENPIQCFSKTYEDSSIPKDGLCAIMTCTEADGNCPFIPGTELRISCPYNDPKAFDGTPQQDEKYNERCKQIATENLFIFSLINKLPMKKYIAELIGTFTLVFCGTGAIIINEVTHGTVTHIGIAITFGLIVMAMIYSLGDVSGAHLNPAVSFAFWTRKELPLSEFLKYSAFQIIGAFLASGILRALFPESLKLGSTLPAGSEMQSFILEIILTFFLMFVIAQVSTGAKEIGIMAGIAIGSVVLLEAMFAGPITGASMNPARSLAPAITSGNLNSMWIYITAPFIGAWLGSFTSTFIRKAS